MLSKEQNENNNKVLEKFMDSCLYYEPELQRRILNFLSLTRTYDTIDMFYCDHHFGLGDDHRRFIEVEIEPEKDEAFSFYINQLMRTDKVFNPALLEHQTFKEGIFFENGQQMKLFKFILKNSLLPQADIDKINTLRMNTKKKFIMISRNPIDFMFCSTNQPFSSCTSANNTSNSSYFFSLPGLATDPNRLLLALIEEPPTNFTMSDHTFTHYRYAIRSFAILTTDDLLVLIRYYPAPKIKFSSLIPDVLRVMEPNSCLSYKQTESKFEFDPVRLKSKILAMTYLEGGFFLEVTKNKKLKWTSKTPKLTIQNYHMVSGSFGRYNIEDSKKFIQCKLCENRFGSVDLFSLQGEYYCKFCMQDKCFKCGSMLVEKINGKNGYFICETCKEKYTTNCDICDTPSWSEDMYFVENKNWCFDCFKEVYIKCKECGDFVLIEDTDYATYELCNDCRESEYVICEDCNELVRMEDSFYVDSEDRTVCNNCFSDNYFFCSSCDRSYHLDDMSPSENESLCIRCFEEVYSYCEGCNEYYNKDHMIISDDGYGYCEECYNEKFTSCTNCICEIEWDDAIFKNGDKYAPPYCEDCYADIFFTCEDCGSDFYRKDCIEHEGDELCVFCYKRIVEEIV